MGNDVNGPRSLLTVRLPGELIEEIRRLAREQELSVEDVVVQACLIHTKSYFGDCSSKEGCKELPNEMWLEFGYGRGQALPSNPYND